MRDFGATGDGVTDDTMAVGQAFAAVPPTGGTVFFPPGTYVIGAQLAIPARTTVRGTSEGTSVILRAPQTYSNLLTASNVADVSIVNLTVDGNHPSSSGSNIFLDACTDVSIVSVTSTNTSGSGIRIAGPTFNVRLSQCSASHCQGDGIVVTGSQLSTGVRRIAITDSIVHDNTLCGIYMQCVTGASVASNIIYNNCISPALGWAGIDIRGANTDISITGNSLTQCGRGIWNEADNTTIVGNTIVGTSYQGIWQIGSFCTIQSNSIVNPGRAGPAGTSEAILVYTPGAQQQFCNIGNNAIAESETPKLMGAGITVSGGANHCVTGNSIKRPIGNGVNVASSNSVVANNIWVN